MRKIGRWRSVCVKTIKVIALLFVALVVTMGVGSFIISRQPPVVIPTPKMPKPNGYDFVVKAGDSLADKDRIDRAASRNTQHNYSLAQKIALVRRNAKALRLVRESFSHEYRMPPQRSSGDTIKAFAFHSKTRTLARLLALDGQVKAAVGHRGQAAESYVDCLRLGSMMPRGGPVIELLIGNACQAIGRRPLRDLADKLNGREARECCHRLEEIVANGVPFAESLEEDKWLMLSIGREVLPKRG